MRLLSAREAVVLGATGLLALITAAWWALALWPLDADAAWLLQARELCFGTASDGLPDSSGWMMLILQPALMFGVLTAGWGQLLGEGFRRLISAGWGKVLVTGAFCALAVGVAAAGVRVANASPVDILTTSGPLPSTYPRLDRPAPDFQLVNQHGDTVTLDTFRGRPLLVTFAFGHCETVCPIVVHDARRARMESSAAPAVVVLTLDPWRDRPSRLPSIAEQWQLDGQEFVLSGPVKDVEAILDRWNVARVRDLRTGDITHPRLIYIVDATGLIAYATTAGADAVIDLLNRL